MSTIDLKDNNNNNNLNFFDANDFLQKVIKSDSINVNNNNNVSVIKKQKSVKSLISSSLKPPKTLKKTPKKASDKNAGENTGENTGETLIEKKSEKKEKLIELSKKVLENKTNVIGSFWAIDKPLKIESIKLLNELLPFYTPQKMEELIVHRAIKSLGISKTYHLPNQVKSEINGISLRAIEWLVTNYSKGSKIVLYNEKTKQRVDIHHAYEIKSNFYKRNLFDPFCRHGRIYFFWDLQSVKTEKWEKVVLFTTVGQLNFMKWADENCILNYAKTHRKTIQSTMEDTLSQVNKEKKKFKSLGTRRKRKELTKAPEIYCTVYNVDTNLHFDHLDSPYRSVPNSPPHKKFLSDLNI